MGGGVHFVAKIPVLLEGKQFECGIDIRNAQNCEGTGPWKVSYSDIT